MSFRGADIARAVERALHGQVIGEAAAIEAAEQANAGAAPRSDLQASGEDRLPLARIYNTRALLRGLTRAQGGTS